MTEKDLKIIYKHETGKEEFSDIEDYLHWLEEKFIQFENENYRLKRELNLKINEYGKTKL